MGIRTLTRRTAFAADASTARIPSSSPATVHLGTRASGQVWRLWAGWLRRPLRAGQREPVRPPVRPPA